MATRSAAQPETVAAGVIPALTAVVFLVASWSHIASPFGDSDEGINGAVWAYNARSLREMGLFESRLGGRRLNGTAYATHPPLLVLTTALLETIAGEREAVTRAPAWLASLAAIPLLFVLGRRAGFRPIAAAAGTAAACLTPMFFVYGLMLDTPVTAFPFGVAVALLWYTEWNTDIGDEPEGSADANIGTAKTEAGKRDATTGTGQSRSARTPSPWLTAGLSFLACLASWQAIFLVGLCTLSLVIRAARHDVRTLTRALPYGLGGAGGTLVALAWTYWAHSGFDVLRDKLSRRTGSAGVSLLDVANFQIPWMAQLLGLTLIGLVAAVIAAVRDRRVRPIATLGLVATFGYAAIFKEGAAGHQYWLYWELLPATVGMSWVFDKVLQDVAARSSRPKPVIGAAIVACVSIGSYNLLKGNNAEPLITDGYAAVQAVRSMPDTGRPLMYVGEEYRADPYVVYYTGRSARFVASPEDLAELATTHPDEPVLVLGVCNETNPSYAFCVTATGEQVGEVARIPPRVIRASELLHALGDTG
ncbi:MAG: hypothetical protein N2037_06985 [Acidimicrobiales bacterium]|nr:hypothetical protein [Acidimicrobiales bacterium]